MLKINLHILQVHEQWSRHLDKDVLLFPSEYHFHSSYSSPEWPEATTTPHPGSCTEPRSPR